MPTILSFRDLEVRQVGMDLVDVTYEATRLLPASERYGLFPQMRRSAVSVPSNVAEGHRRFTRPPYLNHLSIASGSAAELETQFEVCRRQQLLPVARIDEAMALVQREAQMLHRLYAALRAK